MLKYLHNLYDRLAKRALVGLARTGASMSNGSGDYVIAFSTTGFSEELVGNNNMSPLFQAVAEATEEAIYNSLFRATTVHGHRGVTEALPLDETVEILKKYDVLQWDQSLPPVRPTPTRARLARRSRLRASSGASVATTIMMLPSAL